MPKVFVSYSHLQGGWVFDSLVPSLRAGGANVLIDKERFEVGKDILGQMDSKEAEADIVILVLSPDYLVSSACLHEMDLAISRDPDFRTGSVVPILRISCDIPVNLRRALYVNLVDDTDDGQWDLLLKSCSADLGCTATSWLEARRDILQHLRNEESGDFVVTGKVKWRPIVEAARMERPGRMAVVDLDDPGTPPRSGLVMELLNGWGIPRTVPLEPYDLPVLKQARAGRLVSYLALLHFDRVANRNYGADFFAALRYLIVDARKLVLLVHSGAGFEALVPRDHPLSELLMRRVEIRGR